MQNTLFQQGLDLMFYGMGTVFIFLTLLVFSVSVMSRIIGRYFVIATSVHEESQAKPSSTASPVDPVTLAVIQDAIHQHRAKN